MKPISSMLIFSALLLGCAEIPNEGLKGRSSSLMEERLRDGELRPGEPTTLCDPWNEMGATEYDAIGAGTEADPFEIHNADQLWSLATESDAWGHHFVQCRDIDLAAFYAIEGNERFQIATSDTPFTGEYDGREHTIHGFESPDREGGGLFALLRGEVHHLTMTAARITGSSEQEGSWWTYAGVLADLSMWGARVFHVNIRNARMMHEGAVAAGGLIGSADHSIVFHIEVDGLEIWNDDEGSNGSDGGIVGIAEGSTFRTSDVSNLRIQADYCAGGFAGVARDSVFATDTVRDIEIDGSGGCIGGVGGFISRATGSQFDDCSVTNATLYTDDQQLGGFASYLGGGSSVEHCSSDASGIGAQMLGGFAATVRDSEIVRSFASGNFELGGSNSYFTKGGGFAGSVSDSGSVIDCYSTANITVHPTNPPASNTWSSSYAGGFVGSIDDGSAISHSYASGNVTFFAPPNNPWGAGRFAGYGWGSQIEESFGTGQLLGGHPNHGCFLAINVVAPGVTPVEITNAWLSPGPVGACQLEAEVGVAPLPQFSFPNQAFGFDWDEDDWLFEEGVLPALY